VSLQEISSKNAKQILQIIRNSKQISQAEIGSLVGLNPSTVFRIVASLRTEGWVEECEPPRDGQENRLGRPPAYYRVRPKVRYIVGIDLWSQSYSVALIDFSGEAVDHITRPVGPSYTAETLFKQIIQDIQVIMGKAQITADRLLGIGVGAPGVVDICRGAVVYYARIPGMTDFNIKNKLYEIFKVPIYVHNTVSIAAWAAYQKINHEMGHSTFAILIRSGVGGAYIHQGKIFTSQGRSSTEIGHMVTSLLEDESGSRKDISFEVEDFLSEETIFKLVNDRLGPLKEEQIIDLMEQRNKAICDILYQTITVLTQVIRTISNLLNPEEYLIISRFRGFSEFLTEEVKGRLNNIQGSVRFHIARVLPYEYNSIASCKGAAELVVSEYFLAAHRSVASRSSVFSLTNK